MKIIYRGLPIILVFALSLSWHLRNQNKEKSDERSAYEQKFNNHPYNKTLRLGESENETGEPDHPELAFLQDFLFTMDPSVGRPTPEVLHPLSAKLAQIRDGRVEGLSTTMVWSERGPSQVGGRVRALLFDPNDPTSKKVWAGGVSGGLWYNNDITSATSSWQKVNDFWDNLAISCIASDPNNPKIIYVGTGEFEYTVRGGGIWKTIDGGASWSKLASTTGFLEIRDIVVRNENGASVIYAAVKPGFGNDNPTYVGGLFRSSDAGTTWTQVLPIAQGSTASTQYTNLPTDIALGPDNTLWVGTAKHFWINNATSTIYKSSTGLAGSWTSIPSFTNSSLKFQGQIVLAVAPSSANTIYAAIENNGKIGGVFRSTDAGNSWSSLALPLDADTGIPANDFTRGQAYYDLLLAVNPTDPTNCFIGGIDWFATSDAGASWSQISRWYGFAGSTSSVVHADQHGFVFRPGFPNEAVISNDGGVYYTNTLSTAATTNSFSMRNLNFNITQFYTGALHPTIPDFMLGGTQDNGTPKFSQSGFGSTTDVYGGDGAMCFIDQQNPQFQIASYIYNQIGLSTDGGNTFPTRLIDDAKTGNFINSGDYDNNLKILYTARSNAAIYRVQHVTTTHDLDSLIINLGSMASAFRVSPYSTTSSNLFVGSSSGKVFKITDAGSVSPKITEITGSSFPTGSVSCISLGTSENQILVTFYNYGVISVWESRNGGSSWTSREGNLPNMPVRWAEYHPTNPDQVFLATELGVWSTDNINISSPVWNSTNGGLANVRTSMIRIRAKDGVIMASTFGRGVFTSIVPAQINQTITFNSITDKTLGDAPFSLTATASSGLAVSYATTSDKITITGNQVALVKPGRAIITASQAGNSFFLVAPTVNQSFCIKPSTPVVVTSNLNTTSPTLTSSVSSGVQWYLNDVAISGATNATLNVTKPGIYKVQAQTDDCVSDFSAGVPIIVTGDMPISSTDIMAYPNPVENYLEIRGLSSDVSSTMLYDVTGRTSPIVLEKGNETYRANVQHLSSGIYLLRVQEGASIRQIKFLKK